MVFRTLRIVALLEIKRTSMYTLLQDGSIFSINYSMNDPNDLKNNVVAARYEGKVMIRILTILYPSTRKPGIRHHIYKEERRDQSLHW